MGAGTRTLTVEEFDRWVDQPENADKLFEYIGGEIVEVPSNPYVSEIASNINYWLKHYLMQHPIGHVTGEGGGYRVSGERYAPDVAFLAKEKGPLAEKGYHPVAPDLAVEVMSPGNDPHDMLTKVGNYLAAGTVVWVVMPEKKQVQVFVPGEKVQQLGIKDTVDGGDVLPGFTLAVKDIFPE